ncbi:MAG: tail fiber protein [Bacteroidota bacterium]|nr:tail fiber protein [Bacteroidota bacterium]
MLAYNSTLPNGCMACNGQLLAINQNLALFSLLGTTFGGNGQTNFALPDLRSRIPIGQGSSPYGTYTTGEQAGTESVTLTTANLPAHSHTGTFTTKVFSGIGNANTPVNNYPAINPQRGSEFSTVTDGSSVNLGNTSITGSATPINNVQPYCTIQYVITTAGVFPSQN